MSKEKIQVELKVEHIKPQRDICLIEFITEKSLYKGITDSGIIIPNYTAPKIDQRINPTEHLLPQLCTAIILQVGNPFVNCHQ